MTQKIYYRAAQLEDLPILYDFEQGIVEAERPFDETLKDDPINYYDIKAMLTAENTEILVAITNNEIVGSAYIRIEASKPYLKHRQYGYLGFMYVKPEYRGKGINKGMIGELITWAKMKGLQELRLDVYDENHSAVRAYEKAGFKKHLVNMRLGI